MARRRFRSKTSELLWEMQNPDPRRDRAKIAVSVLLHSFWVLGVGIAVAVRGNSTVCIAGLRWPTLFIGIFFLLISAIGYRAVDLQSGLQKIFAVGVFLALLALSVVVVFSYVTVSGKYWGPVSACLRHRNTCDGINWTSSDDSLTISPVQSGCCKPPSSCAFTYVNGTTWSPPTSGGAAGGAPAAVVSDDDDDDCSRWSNDQGTLCFQCDSCKESVLGHIKGVWHYSGLTMWMTAITILLVLIYYPMAKAFWKNEDR